ncbi:hypothetical protein HPP92_021797 [Vanilla planifolia]|uniref:DDT domain-containing protein DDR4 n=1 Tax=Vanilla planifolia TaxID=51239 RepID=A0A835UHZ0_VANPL|nr:hypothetical protein HPP92_021797 [Vanilla planifolia]
MAERRRQGRGTRLDGINCKEETRKDLALDHSLTEKEGARVRLRQRWELASVLNFLGVFRPLISDDLQVSAEEIETALITSNDDLGRIHIALLKGIPPVSKNMKDNDAWISCVCKKLAKWWTWVAEGENPVKADHGTEIQLYRKLEPTTRLLILKALCEVRAEQDDILRYVTDELKKGTGVDFFRKERIGISDSGSIYWYDGNPVIGHRLYKEIRKDYSKTKAKGKGHAQPAVFSQWETVATNLEEFQEISEILSSSKIHGEAFVGETVKTKILPVLEAIEKKKERASKRKQRQILQLEGFLNYRVGATRSCRERRPVRYTFDEYDRTIDEAIIISQKPIKEVDESEYKQELGQGSPLSNGGMDSIYGRPGPESSPINDNGKKWDILSDDDHDDDYNDNEEINICDGSVEFDSDTGKTITRSNDKLVSGLRQSSRHVGAPNQSNFDAYYAATKKRLRQRPTQNAGYTANVIPDSEDEKPTKSFKQTAAALSSSDEPSSATSIDGLQEESGEEESY